MNSVNDIWASVLQSLSDHLTPTSINTWFSDCKPITLKDTCLVISTPNDFKQSIIIKRFAAEIKEAISDIFSCPFDLLVLTEDEVPDFMGSLMPKNEDENLPPEMAGYTFDRFIVGSSNKFAHAAAIAVAENPGFIYNPLFIYGNSGLGKTHLLLAIGQTIHTKDPKAKIAYFKGDDFTNEMVAAIRDGTTESFRTKYRNVDLFLVDDIQFIAGKQQTQNEFFHTFNNIYEAGHQIVITSDRPPMEMSLLDDRLRTRFEGGLMADIQPPDLETRMAIIRNKAAQLGLILADDAIEYIAKKITTNVRQLEGVIKRLCAYKEILNDVITIDSVKRAISDVTTDEDYTPKPDDIINETARFYSLDVNDIRGQGKSKNVSMARHISMYLMRTLTQLSLQEIGSQFENRNHSTVLSSIRKIEDMIKTDKEMASIIRDITSNINSQGR